MRQTPSGRQICVCVVAQNCLAEAYLRQTLGKQSRFRVFNLEQYIQRPPLEKRGAVFVVDACDLGMPLSECLRRLRTRCSDARFLVLDQERTTDEIVHLLVLGVRGFLPYIDASRLLAPAVLSVAANRFWVRPDVLHEFMREAASALRGDAPNSHKVSPREEEILELVRRRLSNREIAQLLRIRVSTVKFHVSNILSKFQVENRHDLIAAAPSPLWRLLEN